MNNIFRNKLYTKIHPKIHSKIHPKISNIKDILNLPVKLYSNTRYNKNTNNNHLDKKNKSIAKIKTNYFKYNKKKNAIKKPIKNPILKDVLKTTNKNIHTHKESIPKRIRELVWTTNNGETFTHKCFVSWCDNNINVFNFQVGHDVPESKGGTLDIDNLKPICINCNLSMSNKYTIKEWSKLIDMKDMKDMKHVEDKNDKKINDSNDTKSTLFTKIKNILPKLPNITIFG